MTHNSDLQRIEADAAATSKTLEDGLTQTIGVARIKAIFAGGRPDQPLGRTSILAFAVFVVGAGLTYVAQLVTARIIGPDSYGVYAYVLAWVTLLGYFSTLGFHVSLLRFVPAYRAKEEWALVRGAIQYSQRHAAGTAISVVLIGFCGIIVLDGSIRPELAHTFLLGIAAVPFLALHLIGASVVRAFGGVVAALAPERVVRDGLLLAIIAAAFWGNLYRLDATLAMAATLLSSVVMLGLVRISLRRLRPPALVNEKPAYATESWWRPALPLTIIMVADNVMSRSGVIALGLMGNTRDAGIFAVAFSMAILTALPRMAVATAFAPTVSALFAREDQAGLQSLITKAAFLSLIGTAGAAIPLLLLAQPLLAWFGDDFVTGAPIVTILALGQVFAAACGPQQHLITMTGHERTGAAMLAVCAGLNFAACMLMIDSLGMTGAALAMTATVIAWNVAMGAFIYRRLHLMPGLIGSLEAKPGRICSVRDAMSGGIAAMCNERGSVEVDYALPSNWARETKSAQSNDAGPATSGKAAIRSLFNSLERKGVRYCHWKSNIRLEQTLAAAEDIDLLVDTRDATLFRAALLENGFKTAQSRSGIGHPGVFHAIGLDEASDELVHLHAYFQIVSGDSLVKSYRLPVESSLLEQTRYLHGVRVPTLEAELVLFALRIALKHVSPIEILMVNRDYRSVSRELAWLREAANAERAEALCTAWFPSVEPALVRQLMDAIEVERAMARRVVLGWRIARRLRGLRRLSPMLGAFSRLWRVLSLLFKRFLRRRDLTLQTGGMIVALIGPKATGKSTIGHALATRLNQHLDVLRIHAGKPPPTALTLLPRLFVPAARFLLSKERAGEYEKPERRREKQFSLLYVLRMTLLAYDRRMLLGRALRAATAGSVVISDRYPSESVGAIDSCCFDEMALAKCGSPLKRWLMNRERALYKGLPKPGLVLRLTAPIETTIERDAGRLKHGGPDAAAVQRRWALESRPEFSGTPVIQIDTNRPLDETVRTVVRAVWSAL